MKYIEFVLQIKVDAPKFLFSIIKNTVIFHEDNQGEIALAVGMKMWPLTKNIAIKYHHLWSFVTNGDIEIQYIDTKEQISDIFTKQLDSELFRYLCYKINYC